MARPRTTTSPRAVGRSVRAALVVVLALLATLGFAGPAAAHATLVGSDPADGSTLPSAPTRVTLTFDDALEDFAPVVTVTGPDGNQYQSGDAVIDGVTVSTAVQPLPAAGTYTIAYRVVSDDGHPVQGELSFVLATASSATATSGPVSSPAPPATSTAAPAGNAGGPSPSPAVGSAGPPTVTSGSDSAAATSAGGGSLWPWLIVGLVVVLGVGAVLLARQRRAGRPRTDGPSDPEGPRPGP